MIEINFACLLFFKRSRIPSFPIVLKTYDEYGPGKPSRESMNNPSSSMISGFLCLKNAFCAFFIAMSLREFDWISSKSDFKKPSFIPKESKIFLPHDICGCSKKQRIDQTTSAYLPRLSISETNLVILA